MGEEIEVTSDGSSIESLEKQIRNELAGIELDLNNLPSRKDVDVRDEIADKRRKVKQLEATGGPPESPESHPVAVSKKVETLSEDLYIVEHSLSRERLRRKEVEARLEKAEVVIAELHADMHKFHEMYGTRVDVWLQTTPKWVRAIYYPVRVLLAGSVAMTAFNFPTALLASAFDWTSFSKFLWFGAVAGFVGFFVFGFLSKLTAPSWAKKKEQDPEKKDQASEQLQKF